MTALSRSGAWAVGLHCQNVTYCDPPQDTNAIVVHWNGTNWPPAKVPALPGPSLLEAVRAISPKDIWAVGYYCGSVQDSDHALERQLVGHCS